MRAHGAWWARTQVGLPAVVLLLACVWAWSSTATAQITPAGLGDAKTAYWMALGVRQELGVRNRWESMSYAGFGSISQPDNFNLFDKPALLVLNQEFYDNFRKDLGYSLALSLRRQYQYEDAPPYEEDDPSARFEFRIYGRFFHTLHFGDVQIENGLRSELRTFYPRYEDAEVLQFRLRFRTKAQWAVDSQHVHRLIGSAEVLASMAKQRDAGFGTFDYQESRFCLYYSFSPENLDWVFDIGYMNNLLGNSRPLVDVHYLALDVTWKNPFGKPHEKRLPRGPLQ